MSLRDAPRKPTAKGPPTGASIFAAWLWDCIAGGKFPFVDTDTVKIDRSRQGYAFNVVPRGLGGSSSKPLMYPFRAYNASNIANKSDSWRTFQVRDGAVSFRSKWFTPSVTVGSGSPFSGGNFENVILSIFGTDLQEYYESPAIPTATVLKAIPSTGPVQINAVAAVSQFMLSDIPDDNGGYSAAVWVVITDDQNNGYSASLWAQMFTNNPVDSTGRPQSPFPAPSPLIIPIALINCGSYPDGNHIFDDIIQIQYGNLVNRYPPGQGPFSGSPLFDRGNWTADNLKGQVFWPGDMVCAKTAGNTTGVFIHNNTVAAELTSPAIETNAWRYFAKGPDGAG